MDFLRQVKDAVIYFSTISFRLWMQLCNALFKPSAMLKLKKSNREALQAHVKMMIMNHWKVDIIHYLGFCIIQAMQQENRPLNFDEICQIVGVVENSDPEMTRHSLRNVLGIGILYSYIEENVHGEFQLTALMQLFLEHNQITPFNIAMVKNYFGQLAYESQLDALRAMESESDASSEPKSDPNSVPSNENEPPQTNNERRSEFGATIGNTSILRQIKPNSGGLPVSKVSEAIKQDDDANFSHLRDPRSIRIIYVDDDDSDDDEKKIDERENVPNDVPNEVMYDSEQSVENLRNEVNYTESPNYDATEKLSATEDSNKKMNDPQMKDLENEIDCSEYSHCDATADEAINKKINDQEILPIPVSHASQSAHNQKQSANNKAHASKVYNQRALQQDHQKTYSNGSQHAVLRSALILGYAKQPLSIIAEKKVQVSPSDNVCTAVIEYGNDSNENDKEEDEEFLNALKDPRVKILLKKPNSSDC